MILHMIFVEKHFHKHRPYQISTIYIDWIQKGLRLITCLHKYCLCDCYILYIRIEFALWSIEQIKCILLESGLKCQWYLDSLVMNLLALHGALAVIAFSHYSTTSLLLYIFQIFPSNLSKQSLEEASNSLFVGATP